MKNRTLDIGYFTAEESERLSKNGIDSMSGTYSANDLIKAGVAFTNVIGPAMIRGTRNNVKPVFDAKINYGDGKELDLSERRVLFSEELDAVQKYQATNSKYITDNNPKDISVKMEDILEEAKKRSGLEDKLQIDILASATQELMKENEGDRTNYREFWLGSDENAEVYRNAGMNNCIIGGIFSDDIKVNKINGIPYEIVGSRSGALRQGSPFLNSEADLSENTDVTFYIDGEKKRLNMAVVELSRNGLSQMNDGLNNEDNDQVYLTMREFEEIFMSNSSSVESHEISPEIPVSPSDFEKVKMRLKYRVDAWAKK